MSNKEEFLESCLILDTETTSDNFHTAEIIESGFVIRENSDWTIFQELHKPVEGIIPPKIESICYITNKMVANKPPFVNTSDKFQEVVNGYASGYLVAHNHFYDMKVLQRHGIQVDEHQWICTWRMAKKLFNGIAEISETNLPYLRFALELDVPIDMYCHRAGNDSYITGRLLETFVDILEENGTLDKSLPYGPQIYEWAGSPIIYKLMPFGKHKGTPMEDIPKSYWQWAANNTSWFDDTADNYDPDLAASIAEVL